MPKCIIGYDPVAGEYYAYEVTDKYPTVSSEYEVVVDMKASHYRNLKRHEEQWCKDQDFLEKFFFEAQSSGRQIRER